MEEKINHKKLVLNKQSVQEGGLVINKDDEMKKMIEESLEWSKKVYEQNRKITKRLNWMVWGSYFKLAIIIIPIILGVIYLPPLLGEVWSNYQSILGITSDLPGGSITNTGINDQIKAMMDLLK